MRYHWMLIFLIGNLMSIAQNNDLESKLQFEEVMYGNDILDFTSSPTQRIFEDQYGYIWLANEAGIFCYDGYHTIDFTEKLRADYKLNIPKSRFFAVVVDHLDNVWMGGVSGLYSFNLSTGEKWILNAENKPELEKIIHSKTINLVLNNGMLYNCTSNGFVGININTKEITFHALTIDLPNESLEGERGVLTVYPDEGNETIWGAFALGYFRYDRYADSLETFIIDENVKWRRSHAIWPYSGIFKGDTIICPAYEYGMVYFDTLSKSFQQYLYHDPSEQGFLGYLERVKSLLPYDDSRVIINAVEQGVGIFNLGSHDYQYLHSMDKRPFLKDADLDMTYDRYGRIWVQKWRTKKPILEQQKQVKDFISILNVSSRDQQFEAVSLFQHDQVVFDYGQDDFKIEYGLVNTLYPDEVNYEYKIDDFHQEWQFNGNARMIKIAQLPKTSQRLLIRAKKEDQVLASTGIYLVKHVPFYYQLWFWICSIFLFILIGIGLVRWRIHIVRKEERKKAELEKQIMELESKALKSQMNPHFIFNSLNSIKSLIQESNDEKAVHYLTQFSKFVRKVLNYSEEKQISLEEELEMCRHYLEMEKLRFEQSFKFNVLIDANADPSFVQVPPLILQPFLENAIWCGLLHKEGERNLKIEIKQDSDQIICIIDDNGIGREKAKQFNDQKTLERKSFGTELILDRLKVNRAMNKTNFAVQVIDKKIDGEPQGTRVELIFDI